MKLLRWMRRSKAEVASPPPVAPQPTSPPPLPGDSLLAAQMRILGADAALTIVDAGAQHGHTTEDYLEAFPRCRVIALEPAAANHRLAEARLAPFGDRVELLRVGLADADGTADLQLTSHTPCSRSGISAISTSR